MKIKFASLLIIIAFFAVSCKKETVIGPVGPAGPKGATGATGAAGAQGQPGGNNIIVKNYSFAPTDFNTYGTYGQLLYKHSTSVNVGGIDQELYDNGVVLAYYQGFGSTPRPWYSLPQTIFQNNISYSITYNYSLGSFSVQQYPSDYMGDKLTFDLNVKLVIIPSAGKKEWDVDFNDYNAVKEYFKIED